MKIVDFLKQIGVLRAGAVSATYKNAKDRPIELQDDMFLGRLKPKKSDTDTPKKPGHVGKKALVASIIAFILFLVLSLATSVTWLIFIIWLVWLIYVWLVFAGRIIAFKFSIKIAFMILCFVSILTVFVFVDSTESDESVQKSLTAEQCQPYFDKYDGKVLNISSDGLQGTIGIKIDINEGCKLHGWYNAVLSYNLPQNPYKRDIGPSYHYILLMRAENDAKRDDSDGFGALSPVYKNFTSLPGPFSGGVDRSELYTNTTQAIETRYFSWGYEIDTNFSEKRYQEIFDKTKLDIVDGMPYIEEEQDSNGLYSYSINHDRAAVGGKIVKSYTLTIE